MRIHILSCSKSISGNYSSRLKSSQYPATSLARRRAPPVRAAAEPDSGSGMEAVDGGQGPRLESSSDPRPSTGCDAADRLLAVSQRDAAWRWR